MKKLIRFCRLPLLGLSFCCSLLFSAAQAQSESYIALEVNSGRVLYSLNAEKVRPAAFLSHVATAMVVFDWVGRTNVGMNTVIMVPNITNTQPGANPMNLRPGDGLTLRDALYSTLLGADVVSAATLAHYVGSDLAIRRSTGREPIKEFVSEMNLLAKALGMTNTKFRAPHGLDSGDKNETTAADLALLGIYAMRNEGFSFIVSQASRTIGVKTSGGNKLYTVKNTNALLNDPGVDGIKTGSTHAAGACAMIGAKRNTVKKYDPNMGREVLYPQRMVVVVLGSRAHERYVLSRDLIREGWREFDSWMNKNFPRVDGEKRYLNLKGSY